MEALSPALLLCLLLLLVSPTSLARARAGVLRVPLQRRPKTLEEYLTHARHERQTALTSSPHRQAVTTINSDYFITVTVGTPPQPFTVVIKMDANGMWIPSSMCPVDMYDMCRNHRRYRHDLSETYVRGGQMYGWGHMDAQLSYDTVSVGGASVTGQCFAEVIQYRYNDTSIPYDGTWGLNLRLAKHIFSNDSALFRNMVDQGVIDGIVFGLYYSKDLSDPTNAGELIIGGRDPSLYKGKLTYVPSMYDVIWQFKVTEVILLRSPDMPSLCPYGCTAVPGTGSHFIVSSQAAMDTLHKYLGATAFLGDFTYHFDCDSLDTLQPVYFVIDGAFLKLPWQSYVDKVMDDAGNVVCLSSFVGTEDAEYLAPFPNGFYLGDAFFTSIYVEFDADNQRMGFAQSKYSH